MLEKDLAKLIKNGREFVPYTDILHCIIGYSDSASLAKLEEANNQAREFLEKHGYIPMEEGYQKLQRC